MEAPRGLLGYKSMKIGYGGTVKVLYDGRPDMGAHVIVSGQGCAAVRDRGDFREFLQAWLREGAKVTKLHLAIDDQAGYSPTFQQLEGLLRTKQCTTHWKVGRKMDSFGIGGEGEKDGNTLYAGSQQSESYLRVYDKRAERLARGELAADLPESWTRWEFAFQKDKAHAAAVVLADHGWEAAVGLLRSCIEFKHGPQPANVSRWKVAKWWEQLTEAAKRAFELPGREPVTVDKALAYLAKQVAPTMAYLVKALHGEIGWFEDMLSNGSMRLSARHRQALALGAT